jgi:hypothetical protein
MRTARSSVLSTVLRECRAQRFSLDWKLKWQGEKREQNMSETTDSSPMLVRHGRAVWRDVVATKSTAETILDLLSASEDSPVLDCLARLEAKMDLMLEILTPPAGSANAL